MYSSLFPLALSWIAGKYNNGTKCWICVHSRPLPAKWFQPFAISILNRWSEVRSLRVQRSLIAPDPQNVQGSNFSGDSFFIRIVYLYKDCFPVVVVVLCIVIDQCVGDVLGDGGLARHVLGTLEPIFILRWKGKRDYLNTSCGAERFCLIWKSSWRYKQEFQKEHFFRPFRK